MARFRRAFSTSSSVIVIALVHSAMIVAMMSELDMCFSFVRVSIVVQSVQKVKDFVQNYFD